MLFFRVLRDIIVLLILLNSRFFILFSLLSIMGLLVIFKNFLYWILIMGVINLGKYLLIVFIIGLLLIFLVVDVIGINLLLYYL